jgi:hypothetical protein
MHELLHIYSEDDLEILDNIIKQHINLTKEIQMPLL